MCFYNKIIGNWSRNILHGKRSEWQMNLRVFPKGYFAGYSKSQQTSPVTSLTFFHEMKKGICNGPATIFINEKRVCRSTFSDCIEIVRSPEHPVGKDNLLSTDRAIVNCLLVLVSIICFLMTLLMPDIGTIWLIIGSILYIIQLIEVLFSQTTQLLRQEATWEDLELFRAWFYELKKSRPVLTFSYTPSHEQAKILAQ